LAALCQVQLFSLAITCAKCPYRMYTTSHCKICTHSALNLPFSAYCDRLDWTNCQWWRALPQVVAHNSSTTIASLLLLLKKVHLRAAEIKKTLPLHLPAPIYETTGTEYALKCCSCHAAAALVSPAAPESCYTYVSLWSFHFTPLCSQSL